MPELPEVETVKRVLESKIKQRVIKKVEIYWDNIIKYPSINEFKDKMINQRIIGFSRLGKHLIFVLSDFILVSHLRMEGKYFIKQDYEKTKHDHVIFHLDEGYLVYNDTRKFGTMHLYHKTEQYQCLEKCAKDALEITLDEFKEKAKKKKYTLKQLLLDQSIIAGIGNIYADEIIFTCKLHPEQLVSTLKNKDYEKILTATKEILSKAIEAGGTTIRSYTSSLKVDGRFQLQLKVHTQKQCPICGSEIQKIKVSQRGTYLCPKCQKK